MSKTTDTGFDPEPFLANLTSKPGIYQMLDVDGGVLYVGKAKNLKNRVSSYFRARGLNNKTVALVSRIANVEVTITASETEALILEHNLIRSNLPPYNILLRDDKSYPFIFISDHAYPRIGIHRGAKRTKGKYYGPYPNAGAVRESLVFLQKVFQMRQCEESVFKNRSRPCLQYQIGRCTGPCTEEISVPDYAQTVEDTELFLAGKSTELNKALGHRMEAAAEELEFEKAAVLRDQLGALARVQETQYIEGESGDLDIIALASRPGAVCLQVMTVRNGRVLGSRSHFPKVRLDEGVEEIVAAFVGQYYLSGQNRELPREILFNVLPADHQVLAEGLTQHSGRKVSLLNNVRAGRARWVKTAANAAEQNCISHLVNKDNARQRMRALQEALALPEMPERLECYDISHSSGELTVASCVVFNQEGAAKSDYRRFNIDGITPGDDYAAMGQALTRRYKRIQEGEGVLPDILIIDGGKGQMTQAQEVMDELGISDLMLLGIAKGTTRKAGFEHLYIGREQREIVLDSSSPALHLLQQIRDEAHRFAITGHKNRRDKKRRTSTLEGIAGVGAKRRKDLLKHFGGMQMIKRATAEDLAKAPGISVKMAQTIHDALHE